MDETEVTLTPNGYGAQPYLSRDLLEDSRCPLEQGQTVTARVIENVGILLETPDHTDTPPGEVIVDGV